MMLAKITHFVNLQDSITMISTTDDPRILRIPISLVFCSAVKDASARRPRQEITIANREKIKNKKHLDLETIVVCRHFLSSIVYIL